MPFLASPFARGVLTLWKKKPDLHCGEGFSVLVPHGSCKEAGFLGAQKDAVTPVLGIDWPVGYHLEGIERGSIIKKLGANLEALFTSVPMAGSNFTIGILTSRFKQTSSPSNLEVPNPTDNGTLCTPCDTCCRGIRTPTTRTWFPGCACPIRRRGWTTKP